MFDPYHKWLGIPPGRRPPTHYQLLGIAPEEQDPEVIEEAAIRQTAHVRTYQIGPHAAVGMDPQHSGYAGQDTFAVIEDNVTIREFATVHRRQQAVECGHARLEGDVHDPPERQRPELRDHARTHAICSSPAPRGRTVPR